METLSLYEQYLAGQITESDLLYEGAITDKLKAAKDKVVSAIKKIKSIVSNHPVLSSALVLSILSLVVYKKVTPALLDKIQGDIARGKFLLTSSQLATLDKDLGPQMREVAKYVSVASGKEDPQKLFNQVKGQKKELSKVFKNYNETKSYLAGEMRKQGKGVSDINKFMDKADAIYSAALRDSGLLKVGKQLNMVMGAVRPSQLRAAGVGDTDTANQIYKWLKQRGIVDSKGRIKISMKSKKQLKSLKLDLPKKYLEYDAAVRRAMDDAIVLFGESQEGFKKTVRQPTKKSFKASVPTGKPTKPSLWNVSTRESS